jgi:hypothetical protein
MTIVINFRGFQPIRSTPVKEVPQFQHAEPIFATAQPLQTPPPAQFALWRSQHLAPQPLWSPSLWPMVVSQVPISPSQVQQVDVDDAPIIVGTGYAFRPE